MMKYFQIMLLTVLLGGTRVAWAAPATDGLYVTLQTTMGDVCIELAYQDAPMTAAHFMGLIDGSRAWINPRNGRIQTNSFYNGIIFHRVIDGFMIQGGSPQGTGTDGPGYVFPDEFHPALRHDKPGVVSMANSGPHSNGSQFFITVTNTPGLDDIHSVFGQVVEGMSNVFSIARVAVTNDRPLVDVVITNSYVTRNGVGANAFAYGHPALPLVRPLEITLERAGTEVQAVELMTNRQQAVLYYSTDLAAWTRFASPYHTGPSAIRRTTIPDGATSFVSGARIIHPGDTNAPASVAGTTLSISVGDFMFVITPTGSGTSGTFALNDNPEEILTEWQWHRPPLRGIFLALSGSNPPLRFDLFYDTPTSGRAKGFVWDGDSWVTMVGGALGAFSQTGP